MTTPPNRKVLLGLIVFVLAMAAATAALTCTPSAFSWA